MITDTPLSLNFDSRDLNAALATGSKPLNGSSKTNIWGLDNSAHARESRWRIPWLKESRDSLSLVPSPTRSSTPLSFLSATPIIMPISLIAAWMDLLPCHLTCSGICPVISRNFCANLSGLDSSNPSIVAVTESNLFIPTSDLSKVLFPAPFGPTRPIISPEKIGISISRIPAAGSFLNGFLRVGLAILYLKLASEIRRMHSDAFAIVITQAESIFEDIY